MKKTEKITISGLIQLKNMFAPFKDFQNQVGAKIFIIFLKAKNRIVIDDKAADYIYSFLSG